VKRTGLFVVADLDDLPVDVLLNIGEQRKVTKHPCQGVRSSLVSSTWHQFEINAASSPHMMKMTARQTMSSQQTPDSQALPKTSLSVRPTILPSPFPSLAWPSTSI